METFFKDYMNFLDKCKTEWEVVDYFEKEVKKIGFKNLKEAKSLKPGDKVYFTFKDKFFCAAIIGKNPEFRIVAAHGDSPRIELKINPIEIKKELNLSMFKIAYYGGTWPYVWLGVPLEARILLYKKGKKYILKLGNFVIPDHLPHLSLQRKERKGPDVIEWEEMKIYLTNKKIKSEKEILELLSKKLGIKFELKDFARSQIAIVPSIKPYEIGLDNSMIVGYGQDDRVCCFTGFKALIDSKPKHTSVFVVVDREEIGSEGSTSAKSKVLEYFLRKICELRKVDYDEIILNSYSISADVTAGVMPGFENCYDLENSAKLGFGTCIERYQSNVGKYYGNETHVKFIDYLIELFDKKKIKYQFGCLFSKTDRKLGSGETISAYLARYGMEVVDIGVPLIGMHTPSEISSKVDIYNTYLAYKTFFND